MAIVIPVELDTRGLRRRLDETGGSLTRFGKIAAFAASAAALGGLVATVKIGVDEFMQAEKVSAQTNAVLKSTGGIANVTKKQIDELGTAIMRKSGMDDEAVKSAENLLLTFTNIRNEAGKGNDVFTQATNITADLSVAFGKDLNSSAILVGKALNDPVKGLSALSRVGIQFSEGQKETIKKLVESGDAMKAQKMILKELETQVGGSAAAYGETLTGKLNLAKETFRNLAGDIVGAVMPTIANAAGALGRFLTDLSQKPTLSAKIAFTISRIGNVAWTGIESVYTWWTQSGRVELPARVVLIPSGRQQFDQFFASLEASAYQRGRIIGAGMVNALVGAFSSQGRAQAASTARSFSDSFGGALLFVFRVTGTTAAGELIKGIVIGIKDRFASAIGQALEDALKSVLDFVANPITQFGKDFRDRVSSAMGRRGVIDRGGLAKILTDDMRAAIQSARSGLAGAASSLGGMMSQLVNANLRVGGTGPNAAESTKQARELEDRRLDIQEQGLKDALAATEDGSAEQIQAKLDLDQFYFDKSQVLRQRALDDENQKNQSAIDNLAARFNQGKIDATTFANELDGIIGQDKGASLGEAFSLGFTNAIQSLKNAALDIANIIGGGQPLGPDIGAPGSFNQGPATNAAAAAFSAALNKWQDQVAAARQKLKELQDKADDKDSRGGKDVTPAERRRINAAREALNSLLDNKPKKSDYGLALGGILTGRRVIAGEAGAEAVIPLRSQAATDMMRKAFSDAVNGGGDTVYNVTINAGIGTDPQELGREVVKAIKTFERKNGPVFVSA